MKKPLKSAVRELVESSNLDNAQTDALQAMMQKQSGTTSSSPRRGLAGWLSAAAAVVILLFGGLAGYQYKQLSTLSESIGKEVVMNHRKQLPLDVVSDSFDGIASRFDRLDFLPSYSRIMEQLALEWKGGRYCSIQGETAVHMRANDNTGKPHSLYQARYQPHLFRQLPVMEDGEQPRTVRIDGVEVAIWIENGILYALTD